MGRGMNTPGRNRTFGHIAVAVSAGFLAGTFAGAAVLIGPAGFRPPTEATPLAATPSATSTESPVAASTPPSPRSYAAMAFDAAIGEMVLFGGFEAKTWQALGDTWTWNGKRWRLIARQASDPLPRINATMAYDDAHKVVVMRGGIDNALQFVDDTWTWDGRNWKKMSPAQSPPAFLGAVEPMVWDPKLNRVLLFAMTKDPYTQYNVPHINQLWTWDGANWTPLAASGAPTGHETQDAALAFDGSRGVAVFFAHTGDAGTQATWTFDGTSWTQVSATGPRPGIDGRLMASDDARKDIVMLDAELNTWTWNGSRWNLAAPAHHPIGQTFQDQGVREGAAIAYDPVRRVDMLFGGARGTGRTAEWNDTWTWNGSDWAQAG